MTSIIELASWFHSFWHFFPGFRVDSRQIFRGFDVPPAVSEDRSEKCRECAVKILRSLVENTSDLSAALCLGASLWGCTMKYGG